MQMPAMHTARLLIRPTHEADGSACLDIWLDAEMGRYLADPPREKASEAYLNWAVGIDEDDDWYPMVAFHQENGTFIGTCSVVPTENNTCWDLGYCIHKDFWHQGYATEMVGKLIEIGKSRGIRAFTATVAQANIASNALMRKLGFQIWKSDGSFCKQGTDVMYPEYVYRLEESPLLNDCSIDP